MPAIGDFPLIWRWTSVTHALFSESELAGLHPYSATEAARIYNDSRPFAVGAGLNPQRFSRVLVQSADISIPVGCSWLRAQASNLAEQVTLSWDRETALRTSWEFFTAHWDDFCYPQSDEVLILPASGSWVLLFHHEETFIFGNRKV